jgi:peptidoglycan/LPS O-acetylase OafA/YrhL
LRESTVRLLKLPVFGLALAVLVLSLSTPLPLSAIWQPVTIPILLLGTATHPDWRISKGLEWAPMRWIGRISYSVYLWQQLFLVPSWEPHRLDSAQALPLDILLPFVCAAVSYFCIERPAIRLGRILADKFGREASFGNDRRQIVPELA